MARWQIALIVVNIISISYLGAIEFIEKDSFGESRHLKNIAVFTFDNRPYLALTLGVITGFLSVTIILFQPYVTRKKFRDSLMDGVFEQVLDNDKTKARITLFCDARWYRRWYYKCLDFFGLWKSGWKIKAILKYCWEGEYIYIFNRWGTEHKRSKTHFYFTSETPIKCQGIAAQVRQREEEIVVQLPDLSAIDLNIVDENHVTVKEFMSKGYITDYKLLKSINRIAPFIYGNIISAKGGSKKLVLVIDSWANATPFTTRKRILLSTHVKQISATFGT